MKKRKMDLNSKNTDYSKYFVWAVVILLLFLSYKIVQPYIIAIISAFILAYLIKPFFERMGHKINKKLSAVICILFILVIILIPLATITAGLITQARYLINNNPLEEIFQSQILEKIGIDFSQVSADFMRSIINLMNSSVYHLPSMIITLVILIFGIYYILIDWDSLINRLKSFIPFKNKERVSSEISITTKSIVYGTLFIALIEFIFSMIFLYILNIKTFILLPSLIFFLAFIPGLGPALVWFPMTVYYFLVGNWIIAIGILFMGIVLSFGIDAGLRARVIGGKIKMNPLLMLVGILGGISLFGVFGFIIGPLILIYTLEVLNAMRKYD